MIKYLEELFTEIWGGVQGFGKRWVNKTNGVTKGLLSSLSVSHIFFYFIPFILKFFPNFLCRF